MANHAIPTFTGITKIKSANYTLAHGISPGAAVLEISPQQYLSTEVGNLTFLFNGTVITFPLCRVDVPSIRRSADGYIAGLTILDRRWAWRDGEISGRYNQVSPDTTAPFDMTLVRSARWLAELCLQAMGEVNFDVSQLPDNVYPPVDWDRTNPAYALQEICGQTGHRVVLRLNSTVLLARQGVGGFLPVPKRTEDSKSIQSSGAPRAVKLVCGANKYQFDIPLEAVGKDTDGTFKAIADLSYAYTGGISNLQTGFPNFSRLQSSPSTQKLAKETVYRCYRPKMRTASGGPLTIPGYALNVYNLRQILPLIPSQLTRRIQDGREIPKEPEITGIFCERNGSFTNVTTRTKYSRPFQIDAESGTVTFADPIYKIANVGGSTPSYQFSQAELYLRATVTIREENDDYLYKLEKQVPVPGGLGLVRIIKRDDLVYETKTTYNDDGAVISTTNNLSTIMPEINYYLYDELVRIQNVASEEVSYGGIIPIDPDGAIQMVSWSMSDSSLPSTRASRNNEFGSAPIAPYQTRRFWEQIRNNNPEELSKGNNDRNFEIANGMRYVGR